MDVRHPEVVTQPRPEVVTPPSRWGDGPGLRTGSWRNVTATLALFDVFLVGTGRPLFSAVTMGFALAMALYPLALGELRRYRGATVVLLAALACVAVSPVLTSFSAATHATSPISLRITLLMFASSVATVPVILLARSLVGAPMVGVAFALGLMTRIGQGESFAVNAWRFGFAIPTTILTLAICARVGKAWVEVVALAVLAAISVSQGGRSFSSLLLITGVLVLWQKRPTSSTRSGSILRALLMTGALAFGVYHAVTNAALEGYLGESAQERSVIQVQRSGSLLLGGRPEIGAAVALIGRQPLGFGAGTIPSYADKQAAKEGMAAIGYDPDNGYVNHYMLDQIIEVHSGIGDFWIWFGPAGVALSACLLWAVARYLGWGIAGRSGSAIAIFLAVRMCWDSFFSPAASVLQYLPLIVGMVLLPATLGAASRTTSSSARR